MMKFPLHIRILIGFILGIAFGYIFNVNHHLLIINPETTHIEIENWKSVEFYEELRDSAMYGYKPIKLFNESSQLAIIRYHEKLKKDSPAKKIRMFVTYPKGNVETYENIASVEKESSIGADIKPLGEIFIHLLNMIAVPLVLASLIVGAASLQDIKHLAKIGGKLLLIFAFTGIVSVAIGQLLTVFIKPGLMMSPEVKTILLDTYQTDANVSIKENYSLDLVQFLLNIVPKNPFKGLVDGDFLQIVFFAILTGLVLCFIPKDKAKPVINFFQGVTDAMIKMVEKVILIAPFAVFALISSTVAEFGFDIILTLFWYAITTITGLSIVTFIVYPSLVKIFTKVSILDFFRSMKQVITVGFTTSSSSATLPINLDACENKLGISNKIASFVLPIGTTINKDGTALFQAAAAVFIAQVYGFQLGFAEQLTIFITCVITGAATAPVAGAGLIMLVVVLNAAGLPVEGIALIIGIDRLINMCRVVPNVLGDSTAAVIIASSEGELGEINLKEKGI